MTGGPEPVAKLSKISAAAESTMWHPIPPVVRCSLEHRVPPFAKGAKNGAPITGSPSPFHTVTVQTKMVAGRAGSHMALKSTIYKAELQISDMDRQYYASHALTLAQHPSETTERLMVRLLAFALHPEERLEFGRGLSTEDHPYLWPRSRA